MIENSDAANSSAQKSAKGNLKDTTSDAPVEFATSNGASVILDAVVAAEIKASGYSVYWNSNGHGLTYPRIRRGVKVAGCPTHPYAHRRTWRKNSLGLHTPLARLVVEAGVGQSVRYRNGNRADLRRENLILTGA